MEGLQLCPLPAPHARNPIMKKLLTAIVQFLGIDLLTYEGDL